MRVTGGRGLQTKAAQFLPCGNTSGWPPPAPPGGLSALTPSALLSGLATTRQAYPPLPLGPPSHSPARPQPSGWPLHSPQCGGDSLTRREGRHWPSEGYGSCLGAAPSIRAEWGLCTRASPGKVLLWTGEQRESRRRERQGLQLPRAFLPSIAGPGSFGNGRFKNKTRAGCAFLLAHFAAFQLKGESKAWLFITNPDLACSSWGGVAVEVHRPQRNPSENPPGPPTARRRGGAERDAQEGLGEELARRGRPRAVGRPERKAAEQTSPPGLTRVDEAFQVLGPRRPRGSWASWGNSVTPACARGAAWLEGRLVLLWFSGWPLGGSLSPLCSLPSQLPTHLGFSRERQGPQPFSNLLPEALPCAGDGAHVHIEAHKEFP